MHGISFTPLGLLTLALEILIVLFSLSVHESAHAWMADRLGDSTGRMLGRITLNPVPHIDPIGTILVPAVMAYFGGPIFGWAKPVPVLSRNFKHIRRDEAFVAAAGPVSNLIITLASTFILGGFLIFLRPMQLFGLMGTEYTIPWWIFLLGQINLVLALFNFIPIPPLDGSWILSALLPYGVHQFYESIRRYGPILLVIIFFTPLLNFILLPVLRGSISLLMLQPLKLLGALVS